METFIYMGFFPFSKFLLISNMVSLCALKFRLLECEKFKNGCFHPENVYRNLNGFCFCYCGDITRGIYTNKTQTLILLRTPLASKDCATRSLNSVSSSADISIEKASIKKIFFLQVAGKPAIYFCLRPFSFSCRGMWHFWSDVAGLALLQTSRHKNQRLAFESFSAECSFFKEKLELPNIPSNL